MKTKVRGEQLNAELLDLNDTPATYTGHGDHLVIVKDAENGIEFDSVANVVPGVTWVNDIFTSDGTNRSFVLSFNPDTSSVNPTLEGMGLTIGASNDYTISAKTLTLNVGVDLEAGMKLDVSYVTSDQQYSGMPEWTVVDSNSDLATWQRYLLDSTGGSFTLTLPANPMLSDTIHFLDFVKQCEINNVTLARNGSNIMGLSEDLVLDMEGLGFKIIYTGATRGWVTY